MDSIGIVTEETADLTPEIVERHQIAIVPAILNWPGNRRTTRKKYLSEDERT